MARKKLTNRKILVICIVVGGFFSFSIVYSIHQSIFSLELLQPNDRCGFDQEDGITIEQYLACVDQFGLNLPIWQQFNLYLQRSFGIVALEIIGSWVGFSFILFYLWGKSRNKHLKKMGPPGQI